MRLFRRARALWRKVFPRGSSYTSDVAEQQRSGRGPNADGSGGFS